MANSLEIAPTSPNYVRTLTDSLKVPYPTTLACLIPPSLPFWWLLHFPHLWCGYWISLLFASAYFLLLIYCIIFVFVRNSALGLRCYAIKIISYHIRFTAKSTLPTLADIGKALPISFRATSNRCAIKYPWCLHSFSLSKRCSFHFCRNKFELLLAQVHIKGQRSSISHKLQLNMTLCDM